MERKHSFHLIGIGGISMSGIASLLLEKGHQVSGSDLQDSHLLEALRAKGGRIHIGHDPANIEGDPIVVVSAAVPQDNSEFMAARKKGLTVWQRAQAIAWLMEKKQGIAVAGTHGKTTTTSMIALMLTRAGLDPTVLIGGELNDIGGNARLGSGDMLVTEADESDGSLLFYHPWLGVITNIELDHPDYFQSRQQLLDTFAAFMNRISPDGLLVLCAEDRGIEEIILQEKPSAPLLTFGQEKGDLQAKNVKLLPFSSAADFYLKGKKLGHISLQVPGLHNIYNAMACVCVGLEAGVEIKEIKESLRSYKGVGRRFEILGKTEGIYIVDDYAHHPTEIQATIKAAMECNPGRLFAVFQPHRYSRTKRLLEDFSSAFTNAHEVIITSIYGAGEKPIPDISGEDLARLLKEKQGKNVLFIPDRKDIAVYLKDVLRSGDLVLTMGAGDIYKTGHELLHLLQHKSRAGGNLG